MTLSGGSFKYRLFLDGLTLLLLLILAVFYIPYGTLNLTYDSFDFMAASESIDTYLRGHNAEGFSYLTRAPLLPAYLHFFDNKILAGWWLNMMCLTGNILMIFQIGRTLGIQDFLIYPLVIVSTLTFPWLLNHSFLWSEPPFIFLILVVVYCLLKKKSSVIICLLCAILFLFRKAGIFFFGGVVVWYFLAGERKRGLIAAAVCILIFIAWQALEYQHNSTSTFVAMLKGGDSYQRIFYLDTITSWMFPMRIPLYLRTITFILVIIVIVILSRPVLESFLRNEKNQLLLILTLSYAICMIAISGTSGYMDAERYLSVIFPLVMLLLFSLTTEVQAAGGIRGKIFLASLALWSMYPLTRTISHIFWF